ncbi:hypothetical protein L6452_43887 [Arctium lappa]|uniref:Uncharacterized protein n=1 Tax=Arctium lappa TaxID=4217 RepID=A0ACB8XE43_ARCLA|nr:hypothetical protein L6452_43887 [Arctium lappa]
MKQPLKFFMIADPFLPATVVRRSPLAIGCGCCLFVTDLRGPSRLWQLRFARSRSVPSDEGPSATANRNSSQGCCPFSSILLTACSHRWTIGLFLQRLQLASSQTACLILALVVAADFLSVAAVCWPTSSMVLGHVVGHYRPLAYGLSDRYFYLILNPQLLLIEILASFGRVSVFCHLWLEATRFGPLP